VLRAKPGQGDALEALLHALLDNMSLEPCLHYFAILRDCADPDLLVLFEHWRDATEYSDVLKREYRASYVIERDKLLQSPPEVRRLQMLRSEHRSTWKAS
jgi:quinol monooxygenase YgiN